MSASSSNQQQGGATPKYTARYDMKANVSPTQQSYRPQQPPRPRTQAVAAIANLGSRATYPAAGGGGGVGGALIQTSDVRQGVHDVAFYESIVSELPDAPEVAHSVLFTHRCILEDAETPDEQLRQVEDNVQKWRQGRTEEHSHETRQRAEMEEMHSLSERVEYERRCDEQRIRMVSMQTRLDELDGMFHSRFEHQPTSSALASSPPPKNGGSVEDSTTPHPPLNLLSPLKSEWKELSLREQSRHKQQSQEIDELKQKQAVKQERDARFDLYAGMGKIGITEQLSRGMVLSEEEKERVQVVRFTCESRERIRALDDAVEYLTQDGGVVTMEASAWSVLVGAFEEGPVCPTPQHATPPRSPTPLASIHADQQRALELIEEERRRRRHSDDQREQQQEECYDVSPISNEHQQQQHHHQAAVYQVEANDGCCTMLAGGGDDEDGVGGGHHRPMDINEVNSNDISIGNQPDDDAFNDSHHELEEITTTNTQDQPPPTHARGDEKEPHHSVDEVRPGVSNVDISSSSISNNKPPLHHHQQQPQQEVANETMEHSEVVNQGRPSGTASSSRQEARARSAAQSFRSHEMSGSDRWERRRLSNDQVASNSPRSREFSSGYEQIIANQQLQYQRHLSQSDGTGGNAPTKEEEGGPATAFAGQGVDQYEQYEEIGGGEYDNIGGGEEDYSDDDDDGFDPPTGEGGQNSPSYSSDEM